MMLITSRCYDEYTAMFGLTEENLRGVVVDCAAGAASFTAEARERGHTAIAFDPAYAAGIAQLEAATWASISGTGDIISKHPDRFVWDWYGTPTHREQLRKAAASTFLADLEDHPKRYVAAALPQLPLPDHGADLLLCSHLLFTWSDQLDAEWHRRALAELLRVCRGEVRIFPLVVQGTGEPVPFLGRLIDETRAQGSDAHVRTVPFEFQRGANSMLVIRR